jgi:hypothetical protein
MVNSVNCGYKHNSLLFEEGRKEERHKGRKKKGIMKKERKGKGSGRDKKK